MKNPTYFIYVPFILILIIILGIVVFQKSQLGDQFQLIVKSKENEKRLKADLYRIETINKEYVSQINILKKELKEYSTQIEKPVPSEQNNSLKEEIQYVSSILADSRKIHAKVIAAIIEQNLLMISAGKAEGVKIGDQFTIIRAEEYLGKVYIIEVHPNMSAARIIVELNNKKGLKIERRDDAKLNVK